MLFFFTKLALKGSGKGSPSISDNIRAPPDRTFVTRKRPF